MRSFIHIILTPFNAWNRAWGHLPTLTDEWLEYRFKIFDQFAYPSISGQTIKNFEWIVMFRDDTPTAWLSKAFSYNMHVVTVPPRTLYHDKVVKSFLQNAPYLEKSYQFLVTTRMDSDDAIHKDYIKIVQENIEFEHGNIYNYDRGYIVDGKKVYNITRQSNAFATMVEDYKSFKTVKSMRHGQLIRQGKKYHSILTSPLWVIYRHKTRISIRNPKEYRGEVSPDVLIDFNVCI